MLSAHLVKQWRYFSKICKTSQDAIRGITDNSKLLVGGFGICGVPMNLINAVR
jgi:3-oxoacid CoA-transferase